MDSQPHREVEHRPVHHRRVSGSQKHHYLRHLLRPDQPPLGKTRAKAALLFLVHPLQGAAAKHLRVRGARADPEDVDRLVDQLCRELLGHIDDRRLAHVVGQPHRGEDLKAAHRADVDELAGCPPAACAFISRRPFWATSKAPIALISKSARSFRRGLARTARRSPCPPRRC